MFVVDHGGNKFSVNISKFIPHLFFSPQAFSSDDLLKVLYISPKEPPSDITMSRNKNFNTIFTHHKTLLDELVLIFSVESVRIHSINNCNSTIAIIKSGF